MAETFVNETSENAFTSEVSEMSENTFVSETNENEKDQLAQISINEKFTYDISYYRQQGLIEIRHADNDDVATLRDDCSVYRALAHVMGAVPFSVKKVVVFRNRKIEEIEEPLEIWILKNWRHLGREGAVYQIEISN